MRPTKLMYTIKTKVENQTKESYGQKPREADQQGGVTNQANFYRFSSDYLNNAREYEGPHLKEIQDSAYV